MKDNVLKKEWSKKDVKRVRNLMQGKVNEKTTKGIGYSKIQKVYKEGDIWDEDGRTWTIKNGIKQNITKYDNVKKLVRTPLFCPNCKKQMKHRDDADYYRVHKRCYECQLYFESELKQKGLWEDYLKKLHNNEIDAFIKDFKNWTKEQINNESNESFISEQGDVEKWVGGIDKSRALESLDETIKYLESLKK
tara:strand:- start:5363 stop:5938 length:576 start_codon:yes stop_codon:yes gene_type:complete